MCRYHNWRFFLCLTLKSLAIFLWIEMQRCEKRCKGKDRQLLELMTTHFFTSFLFTWKGESGIQNHICLWRNEAKDGGTSSYKIQYDLPPKQSHSAWYGRMEKSIWYHYASYSYFTSGIWEYAALYHSYETEWGVSNTLDMGKVFVGFSFLCVIRGIWVQECEFSSVLSCSPCYLSAS